MGGMTSDKPGPGEAFSAWWAKARSLLPVEEAGTLAQSAWDAAVRAAMSVLNEEVDRLVSQTSYEAAAAVRDGRELVDRLFSTPGQWSHLQPMREQYVDDEIKWLRSLSVEQIEKVRSSAAPGSMRALTAELVLREREGKQ